MDGSDEQEYQGDGPTLQHFRSMSSADVELHLLQQWEACCSTGIQIPAKYLRVYGGNGDLQEIASFDRRDQSAGTPEADDMSVVSQPVTSTVGATPSCPVGATPSRRVGATPSCPVGATPSRPVGAIPSCPVGATPSHPVGATHSRPVGATPSRPVGSTPSCPVGATPSRPVGATPSRPVKHASRPVKHGLRPVHYKTTLAKALSNVLQDSPDIVKLDKLRYLIKNSSASVVSNLRYKKLSKLFRDKLVKQYSKSQNSTICKKLLLQEWQLQL